jgi:hypothetical protein
MTNPRTLAIITQEHEGALEDIALAQRLKSAPDRLKRLAAELESAKELAEADEAARIKEVEDMHLAAIEAQFAGLSDLSITEVKDAKSDSVLSSGFHIRWTRAAWNSAANETLPEPAGVWGFTALEPRVLEWIVQRHPDKIPASIMALAPGNVVEALDRYFIGLRRGFLAS